ncbi:hypothetical protein AMECASPLE_031365, partial [Ameca splendens]
SRSSLSFLPGSVLVFRAPPEGPRLGGRGVGGGLAPLCSFLPPPQGARHSMYHWQAKPDNETACTANAVFEQGRGLPRHAEHTRAGRPTRTQGKNPHTDVHTSPPGRLLEGLTHVRKMLQK